MMPPRRHHQPPLLVVHLHAHLEQLGADAVGEPVVALAARVGAVGEQRLDAAVVAFHPSAGASQSRNASAIVRIASRAKLATIWSR